MDKTPFPEPESPELERFWLYSHFEIDALVSRLCEQRLPLNVFWGSDADFAVTQIMKVDAVRNEIHFDMPNHPQQQRLLDAEEIVCVAFIDNIKLQFGIVAPRRSTAAGFPSFVASFPERVLRLQRREYFRVRIPESMSASCLVPFGPDRAQYESLRVLDLSVGGLAMLAYPRHFEVHANEVSRCYLDLPGVGTVAVAMRIVHVDNRAGDAGRRCGCEFVDLSPQARVMLQRYVNRIDIGQRHASGPLKVA